MLAAPQNYYHINGRNYGCYLYVLYLDEDEEEYDDGKLVGASGARAAEAESGLVFGSLPNVLLALFRTGFRGLGQILGQLSFLVDTAEAVSRTPPDSNV